MAIDPKNTIILITNHFPFGPFESFLEQEIPHLTNSFSKVIIIARDVVSKDARQVPGVTVYRINPESDFREKLLTGWLFIANAAKVLDYISTEKAWLSKNKNNGVTGAMTTMIHAIAKALVTAHHIKRIIQKEHLTGSVTLCSYWLTSSALATTFVGASGVQFTRISRAHGGDVYENRSAGKYLPFRQILASNLNKIFAISTNGADHLRRQINKEDSDKIVVSRLGTIQSGVSPDKATKEFTIVSCSFLVPVKRIELLIDSLSHLRQPIHWIHVGDGPLKDNVELHARQTLTPNANIRYTFTGTLTIAALYEFYRTTYVDLFINTSSSEGIPVTMMEAQSFGIPIVGPHVGGIPEIVNDSCGRIFPVDATSTSIAEKINLILTLPPDTYQAMRDAALRNWKAQYNADHNFSTFVAEILKLQHGV